MNSQSKSIHIILARHGNTFEAHEKPLQVGAKSDLPLTKRGIEQAEYLAKYLKIKNIMPIAIYAGTLRRQKDTARLIGSFLNCEKKLFLDEEALTEIDYGAWEMLSSEQIKSRWEEAYLLWIEKGIWAEGVFGGSLEKHLQDIHQWLQLIKKRYKVGDTIIGITSNGTLRFFYSLIQKKGQALVLKNEIEKLKVKTGHFCELALTEDGLIIENWNVNPEPLI